MFTLVSPMVPMTILVTATATLVYLHSRFVERPPERSVRGAPDLRAREQVPRVHGVDLRHRRRLRGAHDLGDPPDPRDGASGWRWGSRSPGSSCSRSSRRCSGSCARRRGPSARRPRGWIERFAAWLPGLELPLPLAARRRRARALRRGRRGALRPARRARADARAHRSGRVHRPRRPLYRDMKRLESSIPGCRSRRSGSRASPGSVSEPEVLTGLHRFQQALETDPEVGVAVGPTAILRLIRYLGGQGDAWPETRRGARADRRRSRGHALARADAAALRAAARARADAPHRDQPGDRRRGLPPPRRGDPATLGRRRSARTPRSPRSSSKIVGLGPLHAKMAQSLVPTLVESFALTVAIIFATFLVVFRSGSARLMAMIPSLFAILVMFLVMRLAGMPLNVATILIASTVLGTSENDQIHFFYHFLEGRRGGIRRAGVAAAHAHGRRARDPLRDADQRRRLPGLRRSRICRRCVSSACSRRSPSCSR